MTKSALLRFLNSFTNYEKTGLPVLHPSRYNLTRTSRLLAGLSSPHLDFPAVHIAGTVGKGSTAAMIASCLACAGYRTGLYTSPHLVDFRERIQILTFQERQLVQRWISWEETKRLVKVIKNALPGLSKEFGKVTTFELYTSLAFLYFSMKQVDVAVLETGLGGRLDATNVVTPLVSVLTPIGLDHTHVLGKTLSVVAGEKAGIIKPGVPVVCAPQKEQAFKVITRVCKKSEANLYPVKMSGAGNTSALRGFHQKVNAETAVLALRFLKTNGFRISRRSIKTGLKKVSLPGRFQKIQENPVVIVDGAHNPDGAVALKHTLRGIYGGKMKAVFVCGLMQDKDAETFFSILSPVAKEFHLVPLSVPRTASPVKLSGLVKIRRVFTYNNLNSALSYVLEYTDSGDIIVITGSLYLVGETLQLWHHASKTKKHAWRDSNPRPAD